MKEHLQRLARLHRLDSELFDLTRRSDDIREQVESIREAVASLEADLEKQRETLAGTTLLRRSQESEYKAKEDLIGRAKAKLAGVRNTREYMAAEREVESARKDSAMVEEQILHLIEAEDQGKAALVEREKRLQELKEETEAETTRVLAEAEALEQRLHEVETGRQGLLEGLDRQLVSRYEMIRKRLKGAAMAEVVDGVCSSCNMNLPPQLFNTLVRATTVEQCPNCNRIIFWSGLLEQTAHSA